MDDDASSVSSSNASFEEIGSRSHTSWEKEKYKPLEERTVDRLKALVAKSTPAGTPEVVEGDVPDILYTLQYKERYSGKITEC
jgi:hypothetical protein